MFDDNRLVQEAFAIYQSNPLCSVADDAYGMLIMQVMQQHPDWPEFNGKLVDVEMPPDPSAFDDVPQLLTMIIDWPKDCNRLDPGLMRSMAGTVLSELQEFAEAQPDLHIVRGSLRINCRFPNHRLAVRFIVVEPSESKPKTEGT